MPTKKTTISNRSPGEVILPPPCIMRVMHPIPYFLMKNRPMDFQDLKQEQDPHFTQIVLLDENFEGTGRPLYLGVYVRNGLTFTVALSKDNEQLVVLTNPNVVCPLMLRRSLNILNNYFTADKTVDEGVSDFVTYVFDCIQDLTPAKQLRIRKAIVAAISALVTKVPDKRSLKAEPIEGLKQRLLAALVEATVNDVDTVTVVNNLVDTTMNI
jgi:hypothetical protein